MDGPPRSYDVGMWRTSMIRVFPFMSRWFEASAQCCGGACRNCVGIASSAVLAPLLVRKHEDPSD